jgi:hypothetical protein
MSKALLRLHTRQWQAQAATVASTAQVYSFSVLLTQVHSVHTRGLRYRLPIHVITGSKQHDTETSQKRQNRSDGIMSVCCEPEQTTPSSLCSSISASDAVPLTQSRRRRRRLCS